MLTEQLFILLTIVTFVLLTPTIRKNSCEIKINHFLNTFRNDLNYAMNYSITSYEIVKFDFVPTKFSYKISANSVLIKEYKYDPNLVLNSYIVRNSIDITHGNVVNAHYFYLSCGNLKYRVNIYDKSGVVNAVKQ